ncbi:alpha/beta hydrolase [Leptolyngbya ohadii]|uniref:alpha/beta hydrolase n=1 Tax=Leptolyngbya ohadii TaxID=1962290 RepID=UPI000B59E67A|nr:alpha/beta hydrolase [Leptolyngbya ohadii]
MKSTFFPLLQQESEQAGDRRGASHLMGQCLGLGSAIVLGISAALGLQVAPAAAAQDLVITFGILGRSIPIEDLRVLAETGEVTDELRWYVNVANIAPADFQRVLSQEVNVSQRLIDRVTYSLPGEFLLSQVGNTIHTRSRRANIQALRAALLLSTSGDNRLSLLEFLEQYPTAEVYIDGKSLLALVRDVNRVRADIQPVVTAIEGFLETLVCDCERQTER